MTSTNLGTQFREIEEAREEHIQPSFMVTLFEGEPDFSLLFPYPAQPEADRATGDTYARAVEEVLRKEVDPDAIERDARIPQNAFARLFEAGAFGMKVPQEYGGLGLSQTNYNRVLTLVASWCNALSLTLSAHQSIGVAQPLLVVTKGDLGATLSPEGRERNQRQRDAYLRRVATKEISAFALTEPSVGSDPAGMTMEAVLNAEGTHFVVNGDKLWCTNGPIASLIVLMARVPSRKVAVANGTTLFEPVVGGQGATDKPITSFVVDMKTPGIEVLQRCEFEGARGIENGHIRFTDVKIPVENVIGEIGQGLKYALTILNNGRVSIAAICLGMSKQAWLPTLEWARTRTTFRRTLGEHESQTARIGHMASMLFAMDAVTWLGAQLVDRANTDVRIEAAAAKVFCSEATIQFLKDCQVLWGGRGYETAASKRKRGETAFPMEQLIRDAELYRIGEGATDILMPFIAREAWSRHLTRVRDALGEGFLGFKNPTEAWKIGRFYSRWYVDRLIPSRPQLPVADPPRTKVEQRQEFIQGRSRALARGSLRAMAQYRTDLERRQVIVDRLASEGIDLFLVGATAAYADYLARERNRPDAWELADHFYADARRWIGHHNFRYPSRIAECGGDEDAVAIGRKALQGGFDWLAEGSVAREY